MLKKLLAWLKKILAKPEPPVEKPYIVEQGKRVEQLARALSFTIVPARDGDPSTEDVPCWSYDGTDGENFNGGNATAAHFSVRVNAYNADALKLKICSYGKVSEPKLACGWKAGVAYAVELRLSENSVSLTVNGQTLAVSCVVPASATLGYGWPPQKRQGCLGASVTGVAWG